MKSDQPPSFSVTPQRLDAALERLGEPRGLRDKVRRYRLLLVKEALEQHSGNVTRASRSLGVSRQALMYYVNTAGASSRSSE